MKSTNLKLILLTLLTLQAALAFPGCTKDRNTGGGPTDPVTGEVPPPTPIPDQLVGTWYASDNAGPLSENWDMGTFQGEAGFRDFRTMVFPKNGANAVEYSSEIYNSGSTRRRYLYKVTGSLEYNSSSGVLKFHALSGRMRIWENENETYDEYGVIQSDLDAYYSVIRNPVIGAGFMEAKRNDGANEWTVKYKKYDGPTAPAGDYTSPPASGTYVKIQDRYVPTVSIGNQEWTSVNFMGSGGIRVADKPQYGTFYRHAEAMQIAIPQGWRVPTKADYIKLIRSQGIEFNETFQSTDGSDLNSKKLLGNLMSLTGWLKQDGYANNKTGFNAIPANTRIVDGNPYGEGANCILWTSEKNAQDHAITFQLIQMPSDTYANFGILPETYRSIYAPIRFVRDK